MQFELYSECTLWYGVPLDDDLDWYEEDEELKIPVQIEKPVHSKKPVVIENPVGFKKSVHLRKQRGRIVNVSRG